MSSNDQTPGAWEPPTTPGTFVPETWQAPNQPNQPTAPTDPGTWAAPTEPGQPPAAPPGPTFAPPPSNPVLYPAGRVGGGQNARGGPALGTFSQALPGGVPPVAGGSAIPGGGQPKRRRGCLRAVLIGFAVLIVLVVAAVVFVVRSTAGAEKEARTFAVAMIAGDGHAAYVRSGSILREHRTEQSLQAQAKSLHAAVSGSRPETEGRSIHTSSECGTRSAITYRVRSSGDSEYLRLVLDKEGGKWKVIRFEAQPNFSYESDLGDDICTDSLG